MFDRIDLLFVLDGACIASTAGGRNRKTQQEQFKLHYRDQDREGNRKAALLHFVFVAQKRQFERRQAVKSALAGVCQSCAVLRNPMLERLIFNKVHPIDYVIEICNGSAVPERHGGILGCQTRVPSR